MSRYDSDSTELKFDLFARLVVVTRSAGARQAWYAGAEGKRRPAEDIRISPHLGSSEILRRLADLRHEWATPGHPDVLMVTPWTREPTG